jgi:hypothetical protein
LMGAWMALSSSRFMELRRKEVVFALWGRRRVVRICDLPKR